MVVGTDVRVKRFSAEVDIAPNSPTECVLEFDLAAEEKMENITEIHALFQILREGAVVRLTIQDPMVIENETCV